MIVQLARAERTDDEVWPLERLVDGRRLVDAPGDRLEVMDAEGVGIEVAVPSDDIQRVEIVGVGHYFIVDAQPHVEFAALLMYWQFRGWAQVALAVGRVFEQLAELVAVALRRLNRPAVRLHDQEALLLLGRLQPPRRAARDDEVVALAIG